MNLVQQGFCQTSDEVVADLVSILSCFGVSVFSSIIWYWWKNRTCPWLGQVCDFQRTSAIHHSHQRKAAHPVYAPIGGMFLLLERLSPHVDQAVALTYWTHPPGILKIKLWNLKCFRHCRKSQDASQNSKLGICQIVAFQKFWDKY